MPEDDKGEGRRIVEIEAYAGTVPHPSIIKGYEDAIPDGGKEVIAIVRRQQLFTFLLDMAGLLTSNVVPLLLVLPILFAIMAGALIEITVVASLPIAVFTAGSAIGRVVTSLRRTSAEEQILLRNSQSATTQRQLPSESQDDTTGSSA